LRLCAFARALFLEAPFSRGREEVSHRHPTGPAQTRAQGLSGPIGGPNVAVSIDGRVDAFVLGLMIRHRVLYDGARTQQMTSAILRVTFGFWG